jgi:AAA15 family ATPase/GTPase
MITYIKIHGFKSFHNFEMVFTPLAVGVASLVRRKKAGIVLTGPRVRKKIMKT